jgi:hypothetical protein
MLGDVHSPLAKTTVRVQGLGILVNMGFVMRKEPRGKGNLGSDVVKHTSNTTCKKRHVSQEKTTLSSTVSSNQSSLPV